jgi:hypothetical protein
MINPFDSSPDPRLAEIVRDFTDRLNRGEIRLENESLIEKYVAEYGARYPDLAKEEIRSELRLAAQLFLTFEDLPSTEKSHLPPGPARTLGNLGSLAPGLMD